MTSNEKYPVSLDSFLREGLELYGVADAVRRPDEEKAYGRWIGNGYHGTMEYLARHAAMKYDPEAVLPGCASVLCAGLEYYQKTETALPPGHGTVALYAWGRDYHTVFKEKLIRIEERLGKLHPGASWRTFTDTAPISERVYARDAGLGFIGKNSLLVNGESGSRFFLGEILTTHRFYPPDRRYGEPTGAKGRNREAAGAAGCPEGCDLCIRACPTGALKREGAVDSSRCVSYLTIEHKGPVPDQLAAGIGVRIFGCDACQDACPFNAHSRITREPAFLNHIAGPFLPVEEILNMDAPSAFRNRFAGSPLERAGLHRLVRNACIVAGNLRLSGTVPSLKRLVASPDPGIAFHASAALRILA